MRPNNIEDIHPLSPMAQGMLFHTLYAAAPGTYVVQRSFTLRGAVDLAALRRAFQEIVDRHAALRTAFAWEKLDQPVQIVWRRLKLPFEEQDLRDLPPAEQAERARLFAEADRARGFDPTRAPLMRVALLRLADDACRVTWTMHHLLLDGWSTQIVTRELFALHDAYRQGQEIRLDRPRPYGDFIGWLQRQDRARVEAFWRRELEGISAPTPLGVDHPADAGPARFGEARLRLPDAFAETLAAFARERQLTRSTLVQGAWALLLARYAGAPDVVFGSTVSGRSAPIPGIEGMVGLLINTLPVRARVSPAEPVLSFLAALQRREVEAREHEQSSLAEIAGWTAVPRGVPLFESLVVFENFPLAAPAERGRSRVLSVTDGQAAELPPYPLTLTAVWQRTLELHLGYDARRFDPAAIQRMLGHLETLLQGFLIAPAAPLGQLPLLTPAELHDLAGWNQTAAAPGQDRLLHELFEEQAVRTPDAIALTFEGRSLSYRALAARASRLADHLVALGVGPDVRVGVCLERSLELPVALLAVLAAGGAYAPIDPSYPRERVAFMLADVGATVLLTQERLLADLPHGGAHVVLVDAEHAPAPASIARPLRRPSPENLAYVMYTSGSTGVPKGVMIPHRAIVNHTAWMGALWPFGPDDAMLQRTSSSFDASLTEIFLPLTTGARLVLARPGGQRDLEYLARTMVDERVTLAVFVPSLLRALVDEPALSGCSALRRVLSGGEPLPADLVERFRQRAGADVDNFYGPTEAAVDVSWFPGADPSRAAVVPIGRPITGTQLHVLGPDLEPVPVGIAGELHVGGAGLSRGYWRRPDLTAERFIPDPFGAAPGGRLYRTGDLCRRRADGVLEILGRADSQIKLRGLRIELAEIEAALAALPSVREAVVIVREDTPGDQRLAAYLVPDGSAPSAGALRAALAERLPELMIPAAYVVLDALPLAPNGKLDRRALPAPGAGALPAREHVAPRTPIEQAVAAVFAEVLKLPVDEVSVGDAFFELGGHSLLATVAVSRLRAALGVALPLRALFEAPTVAGLALRLESALGAAPAAEGPGLVAVARTSVLPLSFGQERLWFLAQLDPASPAYVIPLSLRLQGDLDVGALERALTEIVRRHEVLRTTFRTEAGKPVGVAHPPAPFVLERASLAALPADAREPAVRAEAEADARRPFDLSVGPVIRGKLLEVAVGDHVLLLTLHHIASDAWTNAILDREISALYTAFHRGEPSPLPELPIQYADYAAWQRARISGAFLDEQLAYWKAQLAGAPPSLDLPTDRPRPPSPSSRGGQRAFALPAALSAGIKQLALGAGATLYMTLLAALDVLLSRYTGQDDVVVGTPIAGRTRAETEGLVGFFLGTLVMRVRLAPELTFKDLLARVKETALGAYAHQEMPFERLVQEMQPTPDPSRSPLFQVIFNLQNAPRETLRLPGLSLARRVPYGATVKVDLTLIMADVAAGIIGRFEYATDLFDASTIERFARHLETLLGAVVREPGRRLADLSILPDDERRRLLVTWNDTAAPFSTRECFHELFEAQVDETPAETALVAGAQRLSYRELDVRANHLAHRLRRLGVGADTVVGLCVGRDADLVVGLLGILKAGGAYLPLDPAHPPRRLVQLLGEARAIVVVTQATLADRLPASGVTRVCLDADAGALAAESDARLELQTTPSSLCYVLFTSGSTGTPKGVAVEHRQLVNYVRGVGARMALPRGARYAYVSTFSADLGNTVLFPALASGGALHLVPEALVTDADALGAYFQREDIDCLKIVPSHLSALLSGAHPEQVIPRRLLVLGGEAATWALIERLEHLAPGCRILNHYGPTETTVGVLTHPVEKGVRPAGADIVPLGRPLPNCRVYVLDPHRQPAPTGVPGEIYIGGAGVARGYLDRPELTAERFVDDPFSTAPGARLYRTGDRARTLPDGALLFLGRADHQVKIRGYRVELGEIEAALASCPGVREAVVLVDAGAPGAPRLVAYVVPSGPPPDAPQIRAFLEQRLPDPLIPSAFVTLDALPLTPNGKIDRRALSTLEAAHPEAAVDAPRSPVEEVLAAIWADVFERERVGIHERFNDLGGHSLLAIQIIARARDALEVPVPLRAIFEAPTVAALAARVEALRVEGGGLVAPPITPAPRDRPLPLSFAQERLWLLDRLEPNHGQYNVCSATRLSGAVDPAALARALGEVVRRHEVLRTTFAYDGREPTQIVHPAAEVPLPLHDLSDLPAEEREAAARHEALAEGRLPFDLTRGPLLRARLLRLAPEEHVLLLSLHHIVSDARTQAILDREVALLYASLRSGQPSPLPDLPLQYADYAVWQRAWLRGEVLDAQLGHFRRALAGASFVLDLPTDHPRPPVLTYRGARRTFSLPAPLGQALGVLSRRLSATLFMTLLSAFYVLLYRWSGQRDLVVGTPMTNRTRPETEGLVGLFLNTLVLRAELSGEMPFEALLQRVREVCLGAYAHQDVPFERLVQDLAPTRDLSRTPLFQVMFTLQTAPGESAPLGSARRRGFSAGSETSKVDLSLFFVDGPRGLSGLVEYATDLFDAATIDRLTTQLAVLLEGIACAPSTPLAALPLLPEAETRRLVVDWNATAAAYPRDTTVPDLFAAQVARAPEAPAVTFAGRTLSYGELDARASRLAAHLRARGVGPEVLVGVCFTRSLDLLVAVLAVFQAGGAYVPLDPAYPRERLAFMAADSGLTLLLTQASLADLVPPPPGGVLHVDADRSPGDDAPNVPGPNAAAASLAYVIYTSGSTGRPKGVAVTQRALVNFLTSMARTPGLVPGDRLLAVTSLSFDIAGLELWLPLVVGAHVEIAGRDVAADGAALGRRLREGGITVLQGTPSTFRLLLDAGWEGAPHLTALIGGEAVPAPLVERLAPRVGALWNMYGPTETTIWSTVHRLGAGAPVLVGRPIANTRAYLLDEAGGLAPTGAAGELYLGGDGVARGYLGRPDLTAERFVPDPWAGDGARMYRTGDRGRFRLDGAVELFGRVDQQVKIRGHRIELGEIEATLAAHPAVREAAVTAREDRPGDVRLVAYVVLAPTTVLDAAALRTFVAQRLPEPMVPAAFMALPALPLTANGKVDRRALPAPDGGAVAHGAFVAPRDGVEEQLAAIWAEVLGVARVSITDDFFALGGHSLLALRIFDRIGEVFGVTLPIASLFQAPTVAGIAELLRRDGWKPSWSSLVPIQTTGSGRPFFCVHAIGGNVLNYRLLSDYLGPEIPFYGLQSRGLGGDEPPHASVEEMAAAYLAELRQVQPKGPYRIGGSSSGGVVAYEMAQQLHAAGERVSALLLFDTNVVGAPPARLAEARAASALHRRGFLLDHHLGHLLLRTPREGLAYLLERARSRLGVKNPVVEAILATRPAVRQVIRANNRAIRRYVPRPYPGSAVMLLSRDEPDRAFYDARLAWADLVAEGLIVRFIPGSHETMLEEPNVRGVAEVLRRCLA